jgi:hypothetical protein
MFGIIVRVLVNENHIRSMKFPKQKYTTCHTKNPKGRGKMAPVNA